VAGTINPLHLTINRFNDSTISQLSDSTIQQLSNSTPVALRRIKNAQNLYLLPVIFPPITLKTLEF
jgi:hypothetical protein